MSKKFRRGAIGILGAAAMSLTLAPMASAAVVDPDPDFNVQPSVDTNVYRFAGNDRIATAISAAQSRDDWGHGATGLQWECDGNNVAWWIDGSPANANVWNVGDQRQVVIDWRGTQVTCTVVEAPAGQQWLDIIVARSDDYSDALAATPLADVLDAPVLINPTNSLDARNAAEINRLAGLRGPDTHVTVHLLGGTNALSAGVENSIHALSGVDATLRYQGIDRFETAVNIATVTVGFYGIESGADLENVNAYITTGVNFPDALAAGAAAAANDGVVLLTNGEQLDNRGFTDQFLINLNNWVADNEFWVDINTTENFAVGGPAVRAAAANDIRVVENYDGADRYETAVLVAEDTFSPAYGIANVDHFAVVSGTTYADALVASAYIANADGPLLLSNPGHLNAYTKAYLEDIVQPADKVFTFGGPGALAPSVSQEIADLFVY